MVKREWVEEHVERQRGVTGVLTHLHLRCEANQLLLQFAALWLSRVLAQQIHQTQIPCFNVVLSATGRDSGHWWGVYDASTKSLFRLQLTLQ